jgi:serine phosphatase RsbU (regulator of sigma subunit)
MAKADVDLDSMTNLFNGLEADAPFARSFRRLVVEMERKQSQRQELIVAARLQQSILPRRLDFAHYGSAFIAEALMRPSREIGGDFYDMILTHDGRRAVLIVADVSGKGVPAAFFMAISRTVIRSAVASSGSIGQALERANALLCAENPECLFVTLFMAELEFETGVLRYVNAGHCDGYLVRRSGGGLALPANAPALAMLPEPRFTAKTVKLGRGDRILLVSDGVTEAFSCDGEAFGEVRLQKLLAEQQAVPAIEALAAIDAAVTRFSTGCEQSDDITCLLVDHLLETRR